MAICLLQKDSSHQSGRESRLSKKLLMLINGVIIFIAVIIAPPSFSSGVQLTPSDKCTPQTGYTCYHFQVDPVVPPWGGYCGYQPCQIEMVLAMVSAGVASNDFEGGLGSVNACPPYSRNSTELMTLRSCYRGNSSYSQTLSVSSGYIRIRNADMTSRPNVCLVVKYNTWGGSSSINSAWSMFCSSSTGTITPIPTCKITGTGTQAVPLDRIISNQVAQAGKTDAGSKTFNLVFDCPAIAKVSVTPSGTALVAAQGVYKNLSTGTMAATNIGVAMECDNGSGTYAPLVPNTSLSLGTTAVAGLTTRTCKASYYSQGNATVGAVSAQTTLTFTYN